MWNLIRSIHSPSSRRDVEQTRSDHTSFYPHEVRMKSVKSLPKWGNCTLPEFRSIAKPVRGHEAFNVPVISDRARLRFYEQKSLDNPTYLPRAFYGNIILVFMLLYFLIWCLKRNWAEENQGIKFSYYTTVENYHLYQFKAWIKIRHLSQKNSALFS